MRTSKLDDIMNAVIQLIERDGVTAVTFEAVSSESGITRGGILYHFPSREAMIEGTHRYLAERWEAEMRALAGDVEEPLARYTAYVRSCYRRASRAELILMMDCVGNSTLVAIWADVIARWAPPTPGPNDERAKRMFFARMAADGLWLHEIVSGRVISAEAQKDVEQQIERLLLG